jgi:PKD repeat protein
VSGWNLDLSSFGLLDTRAVEVVDDQLWVSDGYDFRAAGDPSSHAVFVFDLGGSTSPPTGPDPVASFTTTPTGGTTPLAVTFTDTSTGSPTSWRWSFGDGTGATTPSATHTYTAAGTFTASLTVSNASGSSTVTQQISVTAPAPQAVTPPFVNRVGNPGFESNLRGWAPAHKAGVTLTRVHGGHTGSWCERVSGARTVTLDDAPNWVTTTQPGTYTANLWVRSGRPGATLRLRLREVRGGTTLAKAVVPVRLTDRWQKVSATLVPTAASSSTIDYTATLRRAGKHASFKADDAELTLS